MRLAGKTALITGSSSGIGRATALLFAREGADVVINGRDEKKIAGVVKEVEAIGRRALGIRANVGSFAEVNAMVDKTLKEFSHLDILVSNAGVFHHQTFLDMTEEEWDEVLTVDLKGAFNCCRAVVKPMLTQRWGRIICITAISGLTGYPNMTHIAAAKTGVHGLVKALAQEVASSGVTVNAIAPGLVNTPILVNMTEEEIARYTKAIPVGRIGKPEEIAEACAYFASDQAGYVTGQILNMSGGGLI
ncbi:MAG TPA: SDR family NAD(P)-dependent oxidoreductase [Methylomirabilota bacterium]|jgi:3-oxoacyl-[acyl-carrier protein] reductase|nr:SDR family NAD(P)-dependent oxidoreductase [Methylomirabilota bacterium]